MKITDAWVDDPTMRGKNEAPKLHVSVDEMPDVSIPEEKFSGGWSVGKYGPFVKYACTSEPATAGDFNIRFRQRFQPVVDIALHVGKVGELNFSLPLTRARQLIRKHEDNWKLLVSDKDAEKGRLLWVPVEVDPACRQWMGKGICGNRPTSAVRENGILRPLCAVHVQEHNKRQAELRAAASSK